MFEALLEGLFAVFQWPAIGFLLLGVLLGIWLGAVPGLGGIIGLVLLLPFTFGMDTIPAFALLLGMFAVTSTSDTIALLMDLFPTVCEVAGLKVDHEIEGTSILPTLMGDEQPELGERELYWIRREGGMQFLGLCQHAVRKGPLKLLHNGPFQPLQMFDLESDPKEEADRSGEDDASFRQMAQLLNTTMQDNGAVPWRSGEG